MIRSIYGMWTRAIICCALFGAAEAVVEAAEVVVTMESKPLRQSGGSIVRTPLLILLNGEHVDLPALAQELKYSLEYTQQLHVTVVAADAPKKQEEISKHFDAGNSFILYLSMDPHESVVHSRLYNTLDILLIAGKRWSRRATMRDWAKRIAHDVWGELLGESSPFCSYIAYTKRKESRTGKVRGVLAVCEWDGLHERTVCEQGTSLIAPAWVVDEEKGKVALFFSEFTPVNVRLMKIGSSGQRRIALDVPGTLAGVSSYPGAASITYGRSGKIWRAWHDAASKQTHHEAIIGGEDIASSPVQLSTGDVMYCSKGSLYYWDKETKSSAVCVQGGYCISPAVHEPRGRLFYARKVKGVLQLFVATLSGTDEEQLTFGPGNKVDPTVSPCGTLVAYCKQEGKQSSIWILNTITNESVQISKQGEFCMGPAWSPPLVDERYSTERLFGGILS